MILEDYRWPQAYGQLYPRRRPSRLRKTSQKMNGRGVAAWAGMTRMFVTPAIAGVQWLTTFRFDGRFADALI
jgi:hypothetical protein